MSKHLGTVVPSINPSNKHWMIGTDDTGIVAEGQDGTPGEPGEDAHSPYIGGNGNWYLYNDTTQSYEDSGEKAQGDQGEPGIPVIWKGNSATPPSNPEVNWAYYDTTQNKSFIWNGTSWDILAQDGKSPFESVFVDGPTIAGWNNNLKVSVRNYSYLLIQGKSYHLHLAFRLNEALEELTFLNIPEQYCPASSIRASVEFDGEDSGYNSNHMGIANLVDDQVYILMATQINEDFYIDFIGYIE
jgi:hypothetical protein